MTIRLGARRAAAAASFAVFAVLAPALPASAATATSERDYVTGYGFPDNDPPGSAEIAHPVLHQHAGGRGTYADPVTVAVALRPDGSPVLPWGTRVYFPFLYRYGVVEDSCAGCGGRRPAGTARWLDVWVGGASDTTAQTLACEDKITGVHSVIVNPRSGYRTRTSPIAANGGCTRLYDDRARLA